MEKELFYIIPSLDERREIAAQNMCKRVVCLSDFKNIFNGKLFLYMFLLFGIQNFVLYHGFMVICLN